MNQLDSVNTDQNTLWDSRRLLVVSLFLPYTPSCIDLPTVPIQPTVLPLQSLTRRLSLVSTMANMKALQNPTNLFPSSVFNDHSNIHSKAERQKDRIACSDLDECMIHSSGAGNIGLQNAVNAFKDNTINRMWIGTVGINTDDIPQSQLDSLRNRLISKYSSTPVFVRQDELDGHYNQFCKQVLWKPFHYQLPDYPKPRGYEEAAWQHYTAVNQKFADEIVKVYRDNDIVWINDYHLMLVPQMVRRMIPTATIGFFLHIPFPSSEIFRCLHVRKQILQGLLGADLIGFQTYAFMRHFLMTCTRLLALETTPKGIQLENSVVGLGIYPIGIDLSSLNAKRAHPEVAEIIASLKEKYHGMHVVIGRDKNDYVKGVRQKVLAFERFLVQHPEWHNRVVLIQVVLSTTEANELETHVLDVVSRINSRFGAIGYVPVVYLQQNISFNHYLALLSIADACLITSLRDGMNLTSHEYVVCQETKFSPLIISEFAGTYGSFGAAIRINPWDGQEVANAINEALTMSADEKKYRWSMLYQYVSTNTAQSYVESFVSDTARVHIENMSIMSTSIPRLSFKSLYADYISCHSRLFLLDDEGTLFSNSLGSTIPAYYAEVNRAKTLLRNLCENEHNIVYLMSGRRRSDLEAFFEIPSLGICAENGSFIKYSDRSKWEIVLQDQDFSWRKKVLEVFEYYTDRTPGSFIEQKEIGILWHYGLADKGFASWQAAECQNHLQNTVTATYPVHILAKQKCVEVMPRNVSKATMVQRILEHHQARSQRRQHSFSLHPQQPSSPLHAPTNMQSRSLPSGLNSQLSLSDHIADTSYLFSGNLEPFEPSPSLLGRSNFDYPADTEYNHSNRATISTTNSSFHGTDTISIASIDSHSSHSASFHSSQLQPMQSFGSATPSRFERIDFILCIGNDRSDECMFEYLGRLAVRENRSRRLEGAGSNSPLVEAYDQRHSRRNTSQVPMSLNTSGDLFVQGDDNSFSPSTEPILLPGSEVADQLCNSPYQTDIFQSSSVPTESTMNSHMKRYRHIITCTVGAKCSSAKSYLSKVSSVLDGLEYLHSQAQQSIF
ncbi:hypothetical protein BATDEDRAFT_90772 [Batrachochytrium dendrobatidis JAM81]|uniref:Uncharacterized protein n=2 Tax=Batrachochytrium dendrobatidis TaxID=109871 RepID=F4P943_BATDJ|nr:uncharacterized protein BATDEDRAFT_90772 [Batrachochytrium dendrobatidis JAM81]EGF78115.1 hypothetical protein BATDEDRAFT_90772 [Batrachochytrium dendrobatidis JAM81]KAJ8331210.1 Trehalose-6-P synthase/phosphatase complex subunit [Batrachochytrium dendrobatidis]KAK5667631.1 Trehalose-6-P synthase/phosphatase complex subunit [Batrachochytrium dendrobatidis]|eukprot:XP_006681202.1 hypothetical protein BATDEDRAFT_90772 [Batrachochytrium dendrobatidis JAM81]